MTIFIQTWKPCTTMIMGFMTRVGRACLMFIKDTFSESRPRFHEVEHYVPGYTCSLHSPPEGPDDSH